MEGDMPVHESSTSLRSYLFASFLILVLSIMPLSLWAGMLIEPMFRAQNFLSIIASFLFSPDIWTAIFIASLITQERVRVFLLLAATLWLFRNWPLVGVLFLSVLRSTPIAFGGTLIAPVLFVFLLSYIIRRSARITLISPYGRLIPLTLAFTSVALSGVTSLLMSATAGGMMYYLRPDLHHALINPLLILLLGLNERACHRFPDLHRAACTPTEPIKEHSYALSLFAKLVIVFLVGPLLFFSVIVGIQMGSFNGICSGFMSDAAWPCSVWESIGNAIFLGGILFSPFLVLWMVITGLAIPVRSPRQGDLTLVAVQRRAKNGLARLRALFGSLLMNRRSQRILALSLLLVVSVIYLSVLKGRARYSTASMEGIIEQLRGKSCRIRFEHLMEGEYGSSLKDSEFEYSSVTHFGWRGSDYKAPPRCYEVPVSFLPSLFVGTNGCLEHAARCLAAQHPFVTSEAVASLSPAYRSVVDGSDLEGYTGERVRRTILDVASFFQDTAALPLFREALESSDTKSLGGIALSLGRYGVAATDLAEALERRIDSEEKGTEGSHLPYNGVFLTRLALYALRGEPPPRESATPPENLTVEDAVVRFTAPEYRDQRRALGDLLLMNRLGDARKLALLLPTLRGDAAERAAEYLYRRGVSEGDGAVLLAASHHPEASVRAWLTRPIGILARGSSAAKERFLELMEDPDKGVRTKAFTSLRFVTPVSRNFPELLKKIPSLSSYSQRLVFEALSIDAQDATDETRAVLENGARSTNRTIQWAATLALSRLYPLATLRDRERNELDIARSWYLNQALHEDPKKRARALEQLFNLRHLDPTLLRVVRRMRWDPEYEVRDLFFKLAVTATPEELKVLLPSWYPGPDLHFSEDLAAYFLLSGGKIDVGNKDSSEIYLQYDMLRRELIDIRRAKEGS